MGRTVPWRGLRKGSAYDSVHVSGLRYAEFSTGYAVSANRLIIHRHSCGCLPARSVKWKVMLTNATHSLLSDHANDKFCFIDDLYTQLRIHTDSMSNPMYNTLSWLHVIFHLFIWQSALQWISATWQSSRTPQFTTLSKHSRLHQFQNNSRSGVSSSLKIRASTKP
jgi:hypothetical protein